MNSIAVNTVDVGVDLAPRRYRGKPQQEVWKVNVTLDQREDQRELVRGYTRSPTPLQPFKSTPSQPVRACPDRDFTKRQIPTYPSLGITLGSAFDTTFSHRHRVYWSLAFQHQPGTKREGSGGALHEMVRMRAEDDE
ncbi:hypothetical protein HYFRA_00010521 [Hymenoscyphus fraxineus]|uniref:Uncharacterized protein n=1 Tax=Hymenoscyphus fraxineus TaxID=746836 RepID=A0A9N9L218_9HELO|nr:hypothetical protein HYFRA_00010521 [Hymenoscyphus fraxineus]